MFSHVQCVPCSNQVTAGESVSFFTTLEEKNNNIYDHSMNQLSLCIHDETEGAALTGYWMMGHIMKCEVLFLLQDSVSTIRNSINRSTNTTSSSE